MGFIKLVLMHMVFILLVGTLFQALVSSHDRNSETVSAALSNPANNISVAARFREFGY